MSKQLGKDAERVEAKPFISCDSRPSVKNAVLIWSFALLALLAPASSVAQLPPTPVSNYQRASDFTAYKLDRLVLGTVEEPVWMSDGSLAYRTRSQDGADYEQLLPSGEQQPLFDKNRLLKSYLDAGGKNADQFELGLDFAKLTQTRAAESGLADGDPANLPIKALALYADNHAWACDVQHYRCVVANDSVVQPNTSPNGQYVPFLRDYNLWIRAGATGKETQLTFDGTKDKPYATQTGWAPDFNAVVSWAPDSHALVTYQLDTRGAGELYLTRPHPGRPQVMHWVYPLPGDEHIPTLTRLVVDVSGGKITKLAAPAEPVPAKTSGFDPELEDTKWSPDSAKIFFVSRSRNDRKVKLQVGDPATGAVKTLVEDTVVLPQVPGAEFTFHFLKGRNQILWSSTRNGRSSLYLYDCKNGELLSRVTGEDVNVVDVQSVDEENGAVYFLGDGYKGAQNPWFQQLFRVSLRGGAFKSLTPEQGNHEIQIAPSKKQFVDTYSTPDTPPTTVLKSMDGTVIRQLGKPDISRLQAIGWKPPIPVTIKARDGVTMLNALIIVPSNFDPSRKYPVIDNEYAAVSVSSWSFKPGRINNSGYESYPFAELGFVVLEKDGPGPDSPLPFVRSPYDLDKTVPEHAAAVRELASRYPWMDMDRVGVVGVSAGGYFATRAMFTEPDLYKVGVAGAGMQDLRGFTDWIENAEGSFVRLPDGTSNYDALTNTRFVSGLKGRLLLYHGMMDTTVPPYQTLGVVDALIKANKDFDMLIIPDQDHVPIGREHSYVVRKTWDYLVRYLLNQEPPREFDFNFAYGLDDAGTWPLVPQRTFHESRMPQ